jgi:hydrogenase maturation protein HypF
MFRFLIKGVVQGVGFRPFIYRQARRQNAKGTVHNKGFGVEIITDKKDFIDTIKEWPPLAQIDSIDKEEFETDEKYIGFTIVKSEKSQGETILPPDLFTCKDCITELWDRSDRRYKYYFITCTNCGPRFSMIEDYPYDRSTTSMRDFEMCTQCIKEYENPLDRRYHAQTIACHDCGPKLKLLYQNIPIKTQDDEDTIKQAATLLTQGKPVSIKGIGGFHLCSTSDEETVYKVRSLLRRAHKPFALMVKEIAMAEEIVHLTKEEKYLLESPQRPIVACKKRNPDAYFAISELDTLGIMLPYTALHYLLFQELDEPLVMTSANVPGDPVSINEDVGSYFLTHDRRIVNRCDDSVIKVINEIPFYLRRSRGYTPIPVKIPFDAEEILCVGAELNNVICIGKGNNAFLSQYIGSTSRLKTFDFFKQTIDTFLGLTRVKPKIIGCDLHPAFHTSAYANELSKRFNAKLIQIQHHKAHVCGVAAEHNLNEFVGIACDGVGYGEDGNSWGGEVFLCKDNKITRIGRLEYQPMLGGDSAQENPKKMIFGILSQVLSEEEMVSLKLFGPAESKIYYKQGKERFNVSLTSSTGRILDATAALLDICDYSDYEGRPAMLLERYAYGEPIIIAPIIYEKEGIQILNTTALMKEILEYKRKGAAKDTLAATVHHYLAEGLYQIAKSYSLPIVFSGGVAYNGIISKLLMDKGILVHKQIPAGDGGISFGQLCYINMVSL